jgi:hypothetical protein
MGTRDIRAWSRHTFAVATRLGSLVRLVGSEHAQFGPTSSKLDLRDPTDRDRLLGRDASLTLFRTAPSRRLVIFRVLVFVVGLRFLRGCLAEVVSITLKGETPYPAATRTELSPIGLRQDHRAGAINFSTTP